MVDSTPNSKTKFCGNCGKRNSNSGKFCTDCGKDLNVGGDQAEAFRPASTTPPSYETWKARKEEDRRTFFRTRSNSNRSTSNNKKAKLEDSNKTIKIGLMRFDEDTNRLKPEWGSTINLLVDKHSTYCAILEKALQKKRAHDRHFKIESEGMEYLLLYPDGSQAQFLPGKPGQFFTLVEYKEDLCAPYSSVKLYLCSEGDIARSEVEIEEPEGEAMHNGRQNQEKNTQTDIREHAVVAKSKVLSLPPQIVNDNLPSTSSGAGLSYHQCPTCCKMYPFDEIETHADMCAELWVDPIGDLLDTQNQSEEDAEVPVGILKESPDGLNLATIQETVQKLKNSYTSETRNRVSIRRRMLFQDYMVARKKKWFKPKSLLKITFIGEPAIDDGGPSREFFTGTFLFQCHAF